MKKIIILLSAVFTISCARIPAESVVLTDAIQQEGFRMHSINLTLINSVFEDKKLAIDKFIDSTYTPRYVKKLLEALPANTDLKQEMAELMQAAMEAVDARRQRLRKALEEQKIKLVTKLNKDYQNYQAATASLKSLLSSANKLNQRRQDMFDKIKLISGNKLDINRIETIVDKFVQNSGNVAESINILNDDINNLIN